MYQGFGVCIQKTIFDNMEPENKRRRISRKKNTQKTIFDNSRDETECLKLLLLLDDILNGNNNNNTTTTTTTIIIALPLLKEICEYSTGNFVKCKGEQQREECDGWIHFLHGDNFNYGGDNFNQHFNQSLSYAWNLFKYKCDDVNCNRISHILSCNDSECCKIMQLREDESPYPHLICENALRLKPTCGETYCIEHYSKHGMSCESCDNFFCFSCERLEGSHCATCGDYWCSDHREQSTFFINDEYHCDNCLASKSVDKKIDEFNPYLVLFENEYDV